MLFRETYRIQSGKTLDRRRPLLMRNA